MLIIGCESSLDLAQEDYGLSFVISGTSALAFDWVLMTFHDHAGDYNLLGLSPGNISSFNPLTSHCCLSFLHYVRDITASDMVTGVQETGSRSCQAG